MLQEYKCEFRKNSNPILGPLSSRHHRAVYRLTLQGRRTVQGRGDLFPPIFVSSKPYTNQGVQIRTISIVPIKYVWRSGAPALHVELLAVPP